MPKDWQYEHRPVAAFRLTPRAPCIPSSGDRLFLQPPTRKAFIEPEALVQEVRYLRTQCNRVSWALGSSRVWSVVEAPVIPSVSSTSGVLIILSTEIMANTFRTSGYSSAVWSRLVDAGGTGGYD
jgi:hypothetical protein